MSGQAPSFRCIQQLNITDATGAVISNPPPNPLPSCCASNNGTSLLGGQVCETSSLAPLQQCLFTGSSANGTGDVRAATCDFIPGRRSAQSFGVTCAELQGNILPFCCSPSGILAGDGRLCYLPSPADSGTDYANAVQQCALTRQSSARIDCRTLSTPSSTNRAGPSRKTASKAAVLVAFGFALLTLV